MFANANDYKKTDSDFSRAVSVIRSFFLVGEVVFCFAIVCGIAKSFKEDSMWPVTELSLPGLIGCLATYVAYCFMTGFFELIKHAREIRNEIVALRSKSNFTASSNIGAAITPQTNAGSMRYDSATHQYVKG